MSSFARVLENKIKSSVHIKEYSNIDGIVSVSHTEGGTQDPINNKDLLLRTLAGFIGIISCSALHPSPF
ncbi:UxaA family hydrolase, partial [Patescibacteria group bacterium]|nr:UxaA family hydrolase [Patescibacteria group bacterium]